ncbi:MAG: ABC transporter ATP-binding protein, partial [Alphaproteobacteria bacterium]
MARIVIENLVKTFGAYAAVNGINLEIRDGEFLIMVGPSGCGKTTTLNMISGLEVPTSGRIVIDDTVVNDLEPGERGLGMVFQDLALFPHMTVFENIAFGLRVKKVPGGSANSRALSGRCGSHPDAARQAAAAMLGRREPARGARPHHRHRSRGVPDGRAAVQPRRQTASRHAHRAQGAAPAAKRDLRLCHPRPGR